MHIELRPIIKELWVGDETNGALAAVNSSPAFIDRAMDGIVGQRVQQTTKETNCSTSAHQSPILKEGLKGMEGDVDMYLVLSKYVDTTKYSS